VAVTSRIGSKRPGGIGEDPRIAPCFSRIGIQRFTPMIGRLRARTLPRMDSSALLQARAIEKTFGEGAGAVRALRGVDLDVHEGELVAIMGPSGSGKSTLLHIVGALERPTGGSVAIGGRRYDDLGDKELTRLRADVFGFVFQFFNLLPTLTAAENVLLPALVVGEKPAPYADRVDELLATVGLADRAAHLPTELSGGEQQRIAIARALLRRPEVLLADEPTGNLDSKSGADVLALLRRFVDDGQTAVMVTHDPGASALADRVVFLRDGMIAMEVEGGDVGRIVDAFGAVQSAAPQPAMKDLV
jgi:ABC-type lipoprotein export system ATPase subunit